MDTMSEIYTLIETAENAVHEQRFELAQALAAIAQARAVADIANALRDDEGNGDEPAISLKQLRADVDWLQRYAERN
jgi:hypothetical protein